ncbi:hypothetical protein CBL_01651 [Carabus blaptoides fortunei]
MWSLIRISDKAESVTFSIFIRRGSEVVTDRPNQDGLMNLKVNIIVVAASRVGYVIEVKVFSTLIRKRVNIAAANVLQNATIDAFANRFSRLVYVSRSQDGEKRAEEDDSTEDDDHET